tara:strand:+ start:107 stop:289 length:183 start_codon:yes stop_codon:yes gene_type:complete
MEKYLLPERLKKCCVSRLNSEQYGENIIINIDQFWNIFSHLFNSTENIINAIAIYSVKEW